MNIRGIYALTRKEVLRFAKVTIQTVLTPAITTLLYLLVFSQALSDRVDIWDGVPFLTFLVPGLAMMSVLQNAFANSSSSLIQSKMNGNIVFVLLSPLSPSEFFTAFTLAAILRGVLVGAVVWLVAGIFIDVPLAHPLMALVFAILASGILGALGIIAGVWAEKFDQLAAFQNFIIVPLSFLAGVFYSIESLPGFWRELSLLNPFFYMIDGFRWAFIQESDVSPWLSLGMGVFFFVLAGGLALGLLQRGYKLRS
jgi:ABC-2 type transport system permease protein